MNDIIEMIDDLIEIKESLSVHTVLDSKIEKYKQILDHLENANGELPISEE